MICPILIAIEIIDEAKAIFDEPAGRKRIPMTDNSILTWSVPKPNHLLHELGPRIMMLREMTDSPRELVEAIDDLVVGMIRNRSLVSWKVTEAPARSIYSPDAMDRILDMMESP